VQGDIRASRTYPLLQACYMVLFCVMIQLQLQWDLSKECCLALSGFNWNGSHAGVGPLADEDGHAGKGRADHLTDLSPSRMSTVQCDVSCES
jgi:hypothetical protein